MRAGRYAPQALQVVLPSWSLLQSGVVLVPQLAQVMPAGAGGAPAAPPAAAEVEDGPVELDEKRPELTAWMVLLSEGQPVQVCLPPVPLHSPSPGQVPSVGGDMCCC